MADDVLATIEGDQPHTAIRVRLVTEGADSHVMLEHVAYTAGLGWYVQKSFRLPAASLSTVARQFRVADCLTREAGADSRHDGPIPFPGPQQQPSTPGQRRALDA